MLHWEAASLHSGGTGPGVKCMETEAGVNEACHMPTLKWQWHSEIMKNDDEAEGPTGAAKITKQTPLSGRARGPLKTVCQRRSENVTERSNLWLRCPPLSIAAERLSVRVLL